jgi:hypothetical protein
LLRAKSRRLNRVASTPAGHQRREPLLVVLLLDELGPDGPLLDVHICGTAERADRGLARGCWSSNSGTG